MLINIYSSEDMNHLAALLDSGHTVFTYVYLEYILGIRNRNTLKGIVQSLMKHAIFFRVQSGLRTFRRYDTKELACKIKTPSYISLESALQYHAVIFQDYSQVTTLVSTNTLALTLQDHAYQFRKMKNALLINPKGVISTKTYALATKERAICDMIYYTPTYYFDAIGTLDKKLMLELIPYYPKTTQKVLYTLLKVYA